jgi:CRISPR-associated exonuclease Cas4
MAEPSEPIPLSALQHYLFCPRQCALIHVERLWSENRLTAEGRLLHERTDRQERRKIEGRRVVTAMPVASARLGIAGIADVVEFLPEDGDARPFPVEYKRGRPKAHQADEVQLCAQALCLEEMLARPVPDGALFYGEKHRRQPVAFDQPLRALTLTVIAETRAMIEAGRNPPPRFETKCKSCSLIELCRPKRMERPGNVMAWLHRQIEER